MPEVLAVIRSTGLESGHETLTKEISKATRCLTDRPT